MHLNKDIDLRGKTAIITGGGSGIGRAIAEALVKAGVNVVLASRRRDVLERTASELNSTGPGRAIISPCDLRNAQDIIRTVEIALNSFGPVDILINNSGLGIQRIIADMTEEEWDMVVDTNLKGTFLMTKYTLPSMMQKRNGYIINIASQAAKHGYPEAGAYCASKFGILGFAESLQHEVREYGIRVHSLCPALVQVPPPSNNNEINHGVLQVEDLASAVMFLLSQPERIKFEDIGLYHF